MYFRQIVLKSHLLQMRGLKPRSARNREDGQESHLLQMRGLKQVEKLVHLHRLVSHLLQMRGLKQPFVDVQILDESRIFYRCVD